MGATFCRVRMARNLLRSPSMKTPSMKKTTTMHVLGGTMLCLVPITLAVAADIADDAVRGDIQVTDVSRRGDSVTGNLVSRTDAQIRDIRLLVDMPFLWANEVKPGDDSPGRSSVLTVEGPLAPRGTLAFEFTPNPPLPERTDGRFADPRVHVLGYETITAR